MQVNTTQKILKIHLCLILWECESELFNRLPKTPDLALRLLLLSNIKKELCGLNFDSDDIVNHFLEVHDTSFYKERINMPHNQMGK